MQRKQVICCNAEWFWWKVEGSKWGLYFHTMFIWASLVAQVVKNPPAMQETQVRSLGQGELLEKGMATHFSILAWRIPWTEEPGGLQSIESQRVRHNWSESMHTCIVDLQCSVNFCYSPWDHKESDTTETNSFTFSFHGSHYERAHLSWDIQYDSTMAKTARARTEEKHLRNTMLKI